MKTAFNLAVTLIFCAGFLLGDALHGQQEIPKFGFVRIVNAVCQGVGNAKFNVDGKDIYPHGYMLGQTSGGLSIKQGSHTIAVSKEGIGKGSTKIDLVTGETTTVIAFAQMVPAAKEGDPPIWTIKLLHLKQREVSKGYGLTLVSVADESETALQLAIQGKGTIEKTAVKRLGVTNIDLGEARGEVFVKIHNHIMTTVSLDTPGNYVVVVYQTEGAGPAAIYFFDPKFAIAG